MPISDDRARQKGLRALNDREDPLVADAIKGYAFRESTMRNCPHPAVRKKYASAIGECWVSPWTCRTLKCRYAVTYPLHGGVGCSYK